jgi:putative addiction module CopG family antidote
VSLPGELSGYVQRMVEGGRYRDESDLVREALRRMEAAELADELKQFERAFAGGHERAEAEEDIERVEAAVRA